MKMVYVGHSNSFDFRKELYNPIKESPLAKEYTFFFPHEDPTKFINSKDIIKKCDIFLAEVSCPATGLGIELGWANMEGKKIIAIYQEGQKPSSSLKVVTTQIQSYSGAADLIEKIGLILQE